MTHLFDTHAWFWAIFSPEKLPREVRRVLEGGRAGVVGLSVISVWEFSNLVERGRIDLKIPFDKFLSKALDPEFVQVLPLTADIAVRANRLRPAFASDPADEIIVATAREHDLTIITADRRIHEFRGARTLWD